MSHFVGENCLHFIFFQILKQAGRHCHHRIVLAGAGGKGIGIRRIVDPDFRHRDVEPLSDFLHGPVNNLLGLRTWLGDLLTIQHGACHLLRKRQADKSAAKTEDEGPDQRAEVDRSSEINPEHRQNHINEQRHGERQRHHDQNVGG